MSVYVLAVVCCCIGFLFGRREGVRAERLRVTFLFDRALCVVQSGALHTVRRAVRGDYDADGMQMAMLREVQHREEERKRELEWRKG